MDISHVEVIAQNLHTLSSSLCLMRNLASYWQLPLIALGLGQICEAFTVCIHFLVTDSLSLNFYSIAISLQVSEDLI
jgi:hypothetical protein